MKHLTLILSMLMLATLSACGGEDDPGSDDIFFSETETGTDPTDLPSFDLIESDVAEITCGENAITEDGYLTVACLDSNGETTFEAYAACGQDTSSGTLEVAMPAIETIGTYSDGCALVLCSDNGDTMNVEVCDDEDEEE